MSTCLPEDRTALPPKAITERELVGVPTQPVRRGFQPDLMVVRVSMDLPDLPGPKAISPQEGGNRDE
jgi:hypothetical protein